MSKIIGIYRFKMNDINEHSKLAFCYVSENEYGNLEYHFTEDLSVIRKMFVRYADDNGYNKADLNNIVDHKHFDLNCSSSKEVFSKIKEANSDKKVSIQDFANSYVTSQVNPLNLKSSESAKDDSKDKFPTRIRKFFNNKLTALKNKWNSLNPKTKVGFIGAGMAALSVAIAIGASGILNKFGGPTATNSRVATVTDDNDKTKEQNDKKEEEKTKDEEQTEKENGKETKEEKQTEKETEDNKQNTDSTSSSSANTDESYSQTTSNHNSSSSSSSNGGSSSNSGTSGGESTNTTTTPGSVNDDVPVFQNPDETIDNSNNGTSSSEGEEDPFENVTEEEQGSDIVTGEEEPTEDEDYSEEIDVAPSVEDEDKIDKDDVEFKDELIGNEDAVDDDLSYEVDLPLDQGDSEDYETDYVEPAPLPDPNETAVAGNGDYVTTEEEYNNVKEEEVNTTTPTTESNQGETEDYSEEIEVVPVTQEQEDEINQNTNANTNADVVEQAVNEMAEGNDVSLVFNSQTGNVSIEQNTETNTQTNSMTK